MLTNRSQWPIFPFTCTFNENMWVYMGVNIIPYLTLFFNVSSPSIILAAKWSIVQQRNGISIFDKCKMDCGTNWISLYSTHILYWLQFYLKRFMINVSHLSHFHIYCWLEFNFYVIWGDLMNDFLNHHNNRNIISTFNWLRNKTKLAAEILLLLFWY